MKIQVKDRAGLVKDTVSGAILNVDNRSLEAYKKRKQHTARIENVVEDNERIKQQMKTIEDKLDILLQLINTNK